MGFVLLPALLALGVGACTQQPAIEVPPFHPRLQREDLGRWWSAYAGPAAATTWMTRPWNRDLASGADQAWREHRPLLLWLGEGHPFACPSAATVAQRSLWSEPALARQISAFVLAADDLDELRAMGGQTAAWLTAGISGQRFPTAGVWFFAPDGRLLGRDSGASAAALGSIMTNVLRSWETMRATTPSPSPGERPGALPWEPRRADALPVDGDLFELAHARLAAADAGPPDAFEGAFTREMLWVEAAQAAELRPAAGVRGRGAWPPELARRLARMILADSAAGRAPAFTDAELSAAELTLETKVKRQGRVTVHLSGEFAGAHAGAWETAPAPDEGGRWLAAAPDARGARARAVGIMEMDADTGAILSFKLIAVVQHWDAAGARVAAVLMRNAAAWEEAARYAPNEGAAAADPAAPPLLRAWYADSRPELDGALTEAAWAGVPWSRDFDGSPGARAKAIWHADALLLGVWCDAPECRVSVDCGPGRPPLEFTARADGSVEGAERARCAARSHPSESGTAYAFEILVPWSEVARAAARDLPPAPGATLTLSWSAGAGALRARLLFEASRAAPGSFGAGGGFR